MPELPEVEVSRMGVAPPLERHTITKVVVRQRQLRWPVPDDIQQAIGHKITSVTRRAKYHFLNTAVVSSVSQRG